MNKFNRRKFVERIGLSILGLSLISFNPIKIFGKEKSESSKLVIKSNPLSVKRKNIKRF
jgi:hypothetical protein